MGFDIHMIAGSRACSTFSPAHSAHHQPDKPALCRGPGGPGKTTTTHQADHRPDPTPYAPKPRNSSAAAEESTCRLGNFVVLSLQESTVEEGIVADQVRPEEAARALTEIGQRQEQVIRLAVIPTWYWWAIAALMVAFAAAVDTRQGLVVGIGTAVFVAGVLTTTGWVVFRAVGSAQPRNDLLGPGGVVAILGFVAVTIGVSLAVAFTLKASGVSYAATIGVSVTAVMLVVGGPMLMRHLQGRMLANRSGSRR